MRLKRTVELNEQEVRRAIAEYVISRQNSTEPLSLDNVQAFWTCGGTEIVANVLISDCTQEAEPTPATPTYPRQSEVYFEMRDYTTSERLQRAKEDGLPYYRAVRDKAIRDLTGAFVCWENYLTEDEPKGGVS